MLTLLLVVALSAPAAAEWGLYVNRDNQSWKMERTFAFDKDCQAAAQAMWKTGTVKGVACQEYSATSFARRGQTPVSRICPGSLPHRTASRTTRCATARRARA